MSRPVLQLALPHAVKTALTENGYRQTEDLISATANDLSTELGVSSRQAEEILTQVRSSQAGPSYTPTQSTRASDLLHAAARIRFSTLSTALDSLLGSFSPLHQPQSSQLNLKGKGRAIPLAPVTPGMVLELSGPPGGGKTSVALAMALSARLLGDDAPKVLIIDTEGSLPPERVEQACTALLDTLPEGTVDAMVAGIHLMRVATQVQMVAVLHIMEEWLREHSKVKLVVIDTLSYHLRQPSLDQSAKKRILELAKSTIVRAATVHGCAVVVTNQLATNFFTAENKKANFDTGDRAVLMPQLGDAWTTDRTIRVALFRGTPGDDLRYAHASVAPTPGASQVDIPWASFDIDNSGLPCDVPPAPSVDL